MACLPKTDQNPAAVALGNFDGVHLGHQRVLRQAVASGYAPVAMVIHSSFSIMTRRHTEQLLADMGLRPVFIEFETIRNLDGASFVAEYLKKQWNAGAVCCGYNFRFGRQGACGVADLKKICKAEQLQLLLATEVHAADGGAVSSTRIRQAIGQGDMKLAASLLGRPYSFLLTVTQGNRRGRTIGFPTINQKLESHLVCPKFGVYASQTKIDGRWYRSITNVGIRPTYRLNAPQSETHILGFQGNLYGRELEVALLRYLREEQTFSSIEALKAQIAQDIDAASHPSSIEQKSWGAALQ